MTPEEARAVLAEQCPELALAAVSGPSAGTSNECFLVDGEWIFRFPKDAESEAGLRRELLVLPRLAAELDPPVPRYLVFGRPANGYAHAFVGYRKIPGEALTRERLESLPAGGRDEAARRLGSFFTQLHAYPLDRLHAAEAAAGVTLQRSPIEWLADGGRGFRRTLAAKLREHRGHPDFPRYQLLADRLFDDPGVYRSEDALIHGDLSPPHILYCDERRTVTGVIDFGNLAVGDPFADFLQLVDHYGRPFCDRILDFYARPSASLIRRKLDKTRLLLDHIEDFKRLMGFAAGS
jgi:aminoglycoside 2''-phosphotransferase